MVSAHTSTDKQKASVFISCSRSDIAFANRLETGLKERGFAPMIDRVEVVISDRVAQRLPTVPRL
jgi:hypothetical protein